MDFKNIKLLLTRTTGRGILLTKKYSPEILIGVGIIGVIASTIMACKASTKAEAVLDRAKKKLDTIHLVKDTEVAKEEKTTYTDRDYKKDLTIAYVQTGVDFVKLYGPAVTLGIASIACILGSHGIMKKRNLAVVAAYKLVEQSFSDYRKRVVEEFGESKDYELKHGIKKVECATFDCANGDNKESAEILGVLDPNALSQYAKFFDESSTQWSKQSEYNLTFLKCQQTYANDMLHARGHVFLNEIYDNLGIPRTQAGAIVGWVMGKGDDFIDFGIFYGDSMKKRDFVNGYERSILLDFNVDGIIYDLI